MKTAKLLFLLLVSVVSMSMQGQNAQKEFTNPILPGFHPDPSICRVGDDYYMVNSSFTWYPGLPIHHSKDLVNWELIGHAIDRPGMINLKNTNDNNGIWAPTLRYHDGVFYLITTLYKGGGNFYMTAKDPRGPWSDPVWLKDAPGIDSSLFFDDDGKCYYTGNEYAGNKGGKVWPAQTSIWLQELDLTQGKLVGPRKNLTYGHANNAAYAEGPHLYKMNGRYVLLMAEGGTDYYHAVTAHQSKSLWGPYVADKVNPVLSHRHLGKDYPIQAVGHVDLVQTQHGDWYSVVLGKRMIDGHNPLARETFLCKVNIEDSSLIFNPGHGIVLSRQERPALPWTPFQQESARDEFENERLSSYWYFVRIPEEKFYMIREGQLAMALQPEVVDSLVNSAMIIRKTKHHRFNAVTRMKFQTKKENEQAGIILYRTANGYYSLLKGKSEITLVKKHLGKKEIVKQVPYLKPEVYLSVMADGLKVQFGFGETLDNMAEIGEVQNLDVISDNKLNRFNGPGVGMYVTSNGKPSGNEALYDWFEYLPSEK